MFKSFRMTMHCFIDLLTFVVSTILFSLCLDLHNAADFLAFPLLLYSSSFGALCFLVFLVMILSDGSFLPLSAPYLG